MTCVGSYARTVVCTKTYSYDCIRKLDKSEIQFYEGTDIHKTEKEKCSIYLCQNYILFGYADMYTVARLSSVSYGMVW